MNTQHEHCSELLAPFLRGDLSESQARSVEEHLASCPECRAEHVAVAALLEPVEEMTDIERARLHRAVWDRVGRTAELGPRTPLMARLAPVLGTAAVLALIAVGIVVMSTGGGDDESGAGGDISAENLDAGTEGGAEDRDLGDDSFGDADGESTALAAQEAPYFEEDAGNLNAGRLARVAKDPSFSGYRSLYDAPQANDMAQEFIEILSGKAGDEAEEVLDCGRLVIANRGGTALVAYGGLGIFEKREALVLGFATSSDAQRLDRYSFWIFAPGDCSQPLRIEEGNLRD